MVTVYPKDDRENERQATLESSAPNVRPSRIDGGIVRVAALGVNAWAVAVALPAVGGDRTLADLVLVALPLVALAIGVHALWRKRASALGLLAVGVPVLLATAVAGQNDAALGDRYATLTTILAAISTLAYAIAAAHALGRPSALRATKESKLARAARARPASRGLRALVLGTTSTMAVLLAIVVPALGSRAAATDAWGEAAAEGRVLAAIVGGAMACVAAAAIVGPSLRAERTVARRGENTLTLTLALVVAATGAIAWAILRAVSH